MTNITPGHARVFQAIRSPFYDNITLMSCTINGEPGVAIVVVDEAGEGQVRRHAVVRCHHAGHEDHLSR